MFWCYIIVSWVQCCSNNLWGPSNASKDITLCEKYPYLEFFWYLFSRIRTEYEEVLLISLYSVRMRENWDQKNSEYRHFSRSVIFFCFRKTSGLRPAISLSIHFFSDAYHGVLSNLQSRPGFRLLAVRYMLHSYDIRHYM